MNEFILDVVTKFYKSATTDIIIGYHFRKIATIEGKDPLSPPIEAFSDHIPRIALFWELQLTGKTDQEFPPFDLISIHKKLHIKKSEVRRWIILFNETLDSLENKDEEIIEKWKVKLVEFERRFLDNTNLFPSN
ncbi:MAG: hypothetical protein KC493_01275 [Bacteriovoracaceae bacterium]|nr:hypothetical protein [Bacteriovoracaceae bacterium]